MKTKINFYTHDKGSPGRAPLLKMLKDSFGLKCFGGPLSDRDKVSAAILNGKEIRLNTERLFRNGWQTEIGFMHNWNEQEVNGQFIGYYLEQSIEMNVRQTTTFECGYCLHQYHLGRPHPEKEKYCTRCLGDEHLKAELLPLIELQPMNRARVITPAADPDLINLYLNRQEQERQLRFDRLKGAELKQLEAERERSEIEYKGRKHLIEIGVTMSKVNFACGSFIFDPCTAERAQQIESRLKETGFTYPYQILTTERVRKTDGTFTERLTKLVDSFNDE